MYRLLSYAGSPSVKFWTVALETARNVTAPTFKGPDCTEVFRRTK